MSPSLHHSNKNTFSIYIFLILLSLPYVVCAQSTMFDPLFGKDGVVKTSIENSSTVSNLLPAKNGKIIAVGSAFDGTTNVLAVVRYNIDGGVDSSYGQNGIILQNIPTDFLWDITSAAVDVSGRIIVGGITINMASEINPYIRLFLENGTLDTSFYKASASLPTGHRVAGIVVKSNSKILVALTSSSGDSLTLVQFNTDASIDKSFGTSGFLEMPFATSNIVKVTLLAGSNLVVAATSETPDGVYGLIMTKITDNGTIDGNFGKNGYVSTFNGVALGNITSDTAERLLIGGEFIAADGSTSKIGLERFKGNGTADSSFGINGLVVTDYVPQGAVIEDNVINAIGLRPGGGVYLAGRNHPKQGKSNFLVIRYKANGSLDSTFGNGGVVSDNVDSTYSVGATLVVQNDDKAIISGTSGLRPSGLLTQFTLVRYRNAIALPVTTLSFIARQSAKGIELFWQVVNEDNFAYYSIERSITGNHFTSIGQVGRRQATSGVGQYSFADAGYASGSNFYRLRMVDKDGQFRYSNIVEVDILPKTTLSVYPNPTNAKFIIEGLSNSEKTIITIINSNGSIERTIQTSGTNFTCDISCLPVGLHLVTVVSGKRKQTFKVLKD